MSFISQFRSQIRTYIYNPVYKGPFEYKNKASKMTKFPFGMTKTALEKEANEISAIRDLDLSKVEVSPFHLVWRHKKFSGNYWNEKLILRRLGLHQQRTNIPVVIPNTPHYNQMLLEVKHLITLKPLKFPNGIPTEKDIGNVKVDTDVGEMRIDPKYFIDQEQLDKATTSPMFTGKYLREYLKWSSGLIGNSMPTHEVLKKDGQHIERFDQQMKDYHKHKHPFYETKVNH